MKLLLIFLTFTACAFADQTFTGELDRGLCQTEKVELDLWEGAQATVTRGSTVWHGSWTRSGDKLEVQLNNGETLRFFGSGDELRCVSKTTCLPGETQLLILLEIFNVEVEPRQAQVGQKVVVTLLGSSGNQAQATIPSFVPSIVLEEVEPETYRGEMQLPPSLSQDATVEFSLLRKGRIVRRSFTLPIR